ncbi:hypothetical protein OTK49_02320 [Vibrio coralliirubri]|uniref:hypothetical protein n=1 Tax=Vibrio coralliirubri TaxID=1516159 RepID=UPI002283851A|nr:hypothetical protein [Vibrio coralliirubri]MCY9861351.1 hypothetical protein [Vibrio coralliirubri]
MKSITNHDVSQGGSLINSGRFNLHGKIGSQTADYISIDVDPLAKSAGFSIKGTDIGATPIEDFLEGKTDSYLLAAGIGLVCNGEVILGRRPRDISVMPLKLTISGGRCSERPSITPHKELAEEFVILASNGIEDRFVRFNFNDQIIGGLNHSEVQSLQEHAIESLSYGEQAMAIQWLDAIIKPLKTNQTKKVVINLSSSDCVTYPVATACVIESYKTIDILLPYEMILPSGWEIKKVLFLENPEKESCLAKPEQLKELDSSDFTAWAWALINSL